MKTSQPEKLRKDQKILQHSHDKEHMIISKRKTRTWFEIKLLRNSCLEFEHKVANPWKTRNGLYMRN